MATSNEPVSFDSSEFDSKTLTSFYGLPSTGLVKYLGDPEEDYAIKKIAILYGKLTDQQKKYFVANLISIFGSTFLRKLKLTLESLNHSDLEFKNNTKRTPPEADKDPPKPPSSKPLPAKRTQVKTPRLPRIGDSSFQPSRLKRITSLNNLAEEDENVTSRLPSVISKPKTARRKPYDIDRFTLTKSMEVIDKPWSLNQVTSKSTFDLKSLDSTDSLVHKLKALFQAKYASKDSSMFVSVRKEKSYLKSTAVAGEDQFKEYDSLPPSREKGPSRRPSLKRSNSLFVVPDELLRQNSFTRNTTDSMSELRSQSIRRTNPSRNSGRSSSRVKRRVSIVSNESRMSSRRTRRITPEELKDIYMKKLQNNYYDRKLWNTLINSNSLAASSLNLFGEKTSREYDSEFSIISQSDWTDSAFAKSISRYTSLEDFSTHNGSNSRSDKVKSSTSSVQSSAKELCMSELTSYQDSIKRAYNLIRVKYLKSLMNFIPEIRTWSHIEKQKLMLVLLETDSKSNLQYLRDCLKKKVKPVPPTIEHLPDNVLLNIFSYLEVDTLNNVSHVCLRWNFLANTPELWLFKCKKLGKKEHIGQVEKLIDELADNNEIDWKQAYIEVQEFVNSEPVKLLRQNYYQKLKVNSKAVRPVAVVPKVIIPIRRKYSRMTVNSDIESYVNFYTKSSSDEEPFNEHESLRSFKSRKSRRSKAHSSVRQSQPGYLSKINESMHSQSINDGEMPIFDPNDRKDSEYFRYSENGDQIISDYMEIKTELIPSKNLLNLTKPAYKLKWKLEDEDLKPYETVVFDLAPISKVQSLNNHRKKITCIDYDKNRIVTGSLDQLMFVYDFKTGQCLGKLVGHKGGIKCLQILKNRLCSGSWDQTLIIWNMIRFEKMVTLTENMDSVSCIYFDMNYLIFGSHDTKINVWKFNDAYYETLKRPEVPLRIEDVVVFDKLIEHHKSGITCLTYDGIDCIISGNTHGAILLITIEGVLLKELVFSENFEPITSIKLVGALILSSTLKGKVLFWNRYTNKLESCIKCNEDEVPVNSVAYFNKRFYTADGFCDIKEYDLATFTCLRQFKAHEGPVLDLVVVNNKIISCGFDKVIIWNMNKSPQHNLLVPLNKF